MAPPLRKEYGFNLYCWRFVATKPCSKSARNFVDDQGIKAACGDTVLFQALSKHTKVGSVRFTIPALGLRPEVFVSPRYKTPEKELAGMTMSLAVTASISPVLSKQRKARKTAKATGGDLLCNQPSSTWSVSMVKGGDLAGSSLCCHALYKRQAPDKRLRKEGW